MPAWATVLITLGGAVIGAGAALGGAWLQMRHARRERRAVNRRELRERGAAVIGPLFRFLTQSRPEEVISSFGEETPKRMNDLEYRWGELGDALYVYALVHPSLNVVDMADEVASAIGSSLRFTRKAIDSRSNQESDREAYKTVYEAATRSHGEAVAVARKLALVLREDIAEPEQDEQPH